MGTPGCGKEGNGGQKGCPKGLAAVGMVWSMECRDVGDARPGMGSAEIHSREMLLRDADSASLRTETGIRMLRSPLISPPR